MLWCRLRPLPCRQLFADRRADHLRQILGRRGTGGGRRGCVGGGGVAGGADPVLQPVGGGGADLRAALNQEIARRNSQDAREERQVLDPEIQASVQKISQAPIANLQRTLYVAALKAGGVDGARQDLAQRTEIVFNHWAEIRAQRGTPREI